MMQPPTCLTKGRRCNNCGATFDEITDLCRETVRYRRGREWHRQSQGLPAPTGGRICPECFGTDYAQESEGIETAQQKSAARAGPCQ